MKIFLDMDGVLADFDGHLLNKFGIKNDREAYSTDWKKKTKEQKALGDSIVKAMKDKGFFRNLPVMPGAHDLWRASHRGTNRPCVLTALPGLPNDAEVSKDKRDWIHEYMNEITDSEFISCMRSEKIRYALTTDPNPSLGQPWFKDGAKYLKDSRRWVSIPNVLVDDLPLNCDNWRDAGGYGILFKNSKQAIDALDVAHSYIYGERIDVA